MLPMPYFWEQTQRLMPRNYLTAVIISLALLISGCATTGSGTTAVSLNDLSLEQLQAAITEAEQLDTDARNQRFVALAGALHSQGETDAALALIERVDRDALPEIAYIDYTIIASELYLETDTVFRAGALLSTERIQQLWPLATTEQQIALYRARAQANSRIGDTEQSITDLIALDALLVDSLDLTENHEKLWQELNKLSPESLSTLEQSATDVISRGWYQLAGISKLYSNNINAQQEAVNDWTALNPTHPASIDLPLDLQLLSTLIEERPANIALLLPLQGKLAAAGKTIRDGFLAAYYNKQLADNVKVKFYNTTEQPINTVYEQAVAEGANLIIGPLAKDKVTELANRELMPVPTLALNYAPRNVENVVDTNAEDPSNTLISNKPFYQFGLSLEDEATQAADRAWLEGHRYAMIIASSADWSRRAAEAFQQRWQARGGNVVVQRSFDKGSNYSDTIKSAFAIDKSESRARKLRRLFGQPFEFEPRRRQDIDMIFLVARSSQGQQIKPTLAFHYAGDIPVYATSQIYTRAKTASKEDDLNGIRFTTLPWTLNQSSAQQGLLSHSAKVPASYERLYAMGIDSFLLHDRLRQLARSPETFIEGTTGTLRLDSEQRIVREQPWAEIVEGEVKPLPYLKQEGDDTELTE